MDEFKAIIKTPSSRLEKPEDWDDWLREIKASTSREFWPMVNPDAALIEPQPFPRKPLVTDFSENAVDLRSLTAPQQKTYESMWRIFIEDQRQYHRQEAALTDLRTRILNSVAPAKKANLDPDDPVRKWLQTLRDANKPSDGQAIVTAKGKYDDVMRLRSRKPLEWLIRWEAMLAANRRYDLSEWKQGVWLVDLAKWMRDEYPELSLMLKMKARDPESNNISNYPTILRDIRDHLRETSRPKTVRGHAMAATYDEPNDDEEVEGPSSEPRRKKRRITKKEDRPCWACDRKGHAIQKCWYLFPEDGPDNWKVPDVMKKVLASRQKADKKLKERVDEMRKERRKSGGNEAIQD